MLLIRRLGLGTPVVEQQFRRMVFNVLARNQDDHVKNVAFLMDREGAWPLAPAYDVIWARKPGNPWLDSHQMSIDGKRGWSRLSPCHYRRRRCRLCLCHHRRNNKHNDYHRWRDLYSLSPTTSSSAIQSSCPRTNSSSSNLVATCLVRSSSGFSTGGT